MIKQGAAIAANMQRRAAAIYCALFLVIGAGAYGFMTVAGAQEPEVSLDAPTYTEGDTLAVDGRTHTVTSIEAEEEGEGEESETTISGAMEWTNESAVRTATLEAGGNATYEGETWEVVVPEAEDPSEFRLREYVIVNEVLAEDPEVAEETARFEGETWVLWADNESLKEPLDEYLPEPETRTFAEGEQFPYEGNRTTVRSVTSEGATLAWDSVRTNTVELAEGANVTLNGQTYLVHFPDESSVQLTRDFAAYQADLDRQNYFQERMNGLFGVSVLSFLTAIVLLGAAYLPVKD